jgi:hypothetical protein
MLAVKQSTYSAYVITSKNVSILMQVEWVDLSSYQDLEQMFDPSWPWSSQEVSRYFTITFLLYTKD